MHRSRGRDVLEQETIAAHTLYIASLARAERVEHELRCTAPGVTAFDLQVAERELRRNFATLRDLLDVLGYVPRGFTARLPPASDARRVRPRRACRKLRHA